MLPTPVRWSSAPTFGCQWRLALVLAVAVATLAGAESAPPVSPAPRERLRFDADWRFAFGHPSDPARDFDYGVGYFSEFAKAGYADGPASVKFDDSAWWMLDLPHDWAVEARFAPDASSSHGYKAIGRNFPERSIGWYRKTFTVPATDLGRRVGVAFDGVFRDSVVWINGFYLGRQPSGYTGFNYDLTDYLNYGGENVIVVRVDATVEEGWFYEGAGIYRHVWLTMTSPLHVAPSGVCVTTEMKDEAAEITVRTPVANDGTIAASFEVEQQIEDAGGNVVATVRGSRATLAPGESRELASEVAIDHPQLWSVDHPRRHRLITRLRSGGNVVDQTETWFGIRTIRFDPNQGFFLNGRHLELLGTNNHQDAAGVGVAVPDALWDFRVRQLKEMGGNAYRCSHHPPAPELLEACDRLGMLVIDENRLMGAAPDQRGQLEQMIIRDRNHPSVILWSLGNEEWAIEGNIKGARIAATMQAWAQRLDPSRRTTVANSGGWGGISSVIDVVGYNYIKQSPTDEQHARYPNQPGVGTEESTTRQTRGIYADDPSRGQLAALAEAPSGGNMELGWQHYAARPYLAGLFYWTGFDYRGEPHPYNWPEVSSQSGILDSCGFPKDDYYYLKAWWSDTPSLHLFPHWNWPGREGQPIEVTCYSNCDEVELSLNGHSLGRQTMPRNGHLTWMVAYAPGALEGRGFRAGKQVQASRVETTGVPAAIRLVPDRTQLMADGADVAAVAVQVVDAEGRIVPVAAYPITFSVEGPGHLLGMGNGDPASHEPDRLIDDITLVAVQEWRGRIAPPGTIAPAARETQPPLPKLGNWLAPLPKPGEVYDLSATFTAGTVPPKGELHLFLPSLGRETSVWLNGRELARDRDTAVHGLVLELTPEQLIEGPNRLQLVVTPFSDRKNHIPELTRLGVVQIRTPAPPWSRTVFNGLAQVIVQSARQPGPIHLAARSPGLTAAEVTLMSDAPPAAGALAAGNFVPAFHAPAPSTASRRPDPAQPPLASR